MAEFRRLLFFADRGKDRSTYLDMRALPDHLIERIAAGEMIEAVLARLPELFREVVVLVDLEGLSYHEAAEVLEIPVGTVRSRLFRARRRLQESLITQAEDMGLGDASSATEKGADA